MAYAQTSTDSAQVNFQPINVNSVTPQSPLYANLIVNNLLHAFSCLMAGASPMGQPCVDYLNGVPVISSINTSGGLLGAVANLNTIVIANPPIRTGQYLATIGDSLGITKEAHAQVGGSGAGVLEPILKLWQVSRNIAYIAMIIIFLIIGLMVMFRQRINPQTVITAQAALPGLVIGLIMITFSYFLASLLTDTAYLATNLVGYYFTAAQDTPSTNLTQATSGNSVLAIFGRFVGSIGRDDIATGLNDLFTNLTPEVQELIRFFAGVISFQYGNQVGQVIPIVGQFIGPIIGLGVSIFTAATPVTIFSTVLWIVAIAALIFQMLKLLLKLINNYLSIIYLVVTSPFHFLAASLPGRQEIAVGWIRNMLCNILAFPAVLAVFYFVAYILGTSREPFTIIRGVNVSGPNSLPLLGGFDLNFIKMLLAYGALVATPAIPDIICEAIGKVGRAGALIGQEISTAGREGQQYAQRGVTGIQQAAGGLGGIVDQPEYYLEGGEVKTRWKLGGTGALGALRQRWFPKKKEG